MPKPQPSIPGLVIGGTGSNAGKTTFTLSLLCALHARGLLARAAKTGPDYIDAAFHASAAFVLNNMVPYQQLTLSAGLFSLIGCGGIRGL